MIGHWTNMYREGPQEPVDPTVKLRHTIDALFGAGVSRHLPPDIDITFSKKTGRIRSVFSGNGRLLCTLRIDGGLAITPGFAQILLKSRRFRDNCVEIAPDAKPFVEDGRSVFAKHVVWCGKNVRISADTPVLCGGRVVAVGRAVLSAEMMGDFERGVAVKVRDSLKSQAGAGNTT